MKDNFETSKSGLRNFFFEQDVKGIILKLIVYIATSFISFVIIQYFHFGLSIESALVFLKDYTRISLLSILVIFLIQLPITMFLGSVWIGSIITLLISCIIGFANYQKMLYRPEPLFPSDISMLKDIKFLLFSIEFKDRILLIVGLIAIVLLLFVVMRKVYSGRKMTWKSFLIQMGIFLLSLGVLYPVATFGKSNNFVKNTFEVFGKANWIPFNQITNYDQNGVVAGLLYNLSSQVIEKPVGYSKDKIKEIADKYQMIAREENKNRDGSLEDVNIVYVMNESFADPLQFEGWNITPDPLPNYREIIQETSSGQMLSQGYGGGTANIEFEALTGISLEPMLPNISIAYTQLTSKMKNVPTIITYFDSVEQRERKKTAIHPFQSSMYKRPEVYDNFGFDEMIFEEDMDYTQKLESSLYISDEASYQQAFKTLEDSQEKDFIHLVTMQGHGPYYVGYFGNIQGFEVEGPVNKMDMLNYLASLSYTDDSLKDYVEEVDSIDEKVLTVFWGDHLPSAIGYGITSINDPIKKYLTPVFIHTNFETPKRDLEIMSPIYYMNEILDMTDSKLTGYYSLLGRLREYLPAFEKEFHIFSNVGNIGTKRVNNFDKEAEEVLNEYDLLVYDVFEGNQYFKELGFFDKVE